jgi:hypothetical protein
MKRPRRRGKSSRRGTSSTARLLTKIGREQGIVAKPKRTTEGIGRCLGHAYEMLGFTSAWDLARFIEDLAGRSHGKKQNVRLPSWKTPEGARHVIAVRCKLCAGRGCRRCDQYGWGIRLVVAIRKHACAKHDAAPPTSAPTPAA